MEEGGFTAPAESFKYRVSCWVVVCCVVSLCVVLGLFSLGKMYVCSGGWLKSCEKSVCCSSPRGWLCNAPALGDQVYEKKRVLLKVLAQHMGELWCIGGASQRTWRSQCHVEMLPLEDSGGGSKDPMGHSMAHSKGKVLYFTFSLLLQDESTTPCPPQKVKYFTLPFQGALEWGCSSGGGWGKGKVKHFTFWVAHRVPHTP